MTGLLGGHKYGVVELRGRISQCSANVIRLQIGKIGQNLAFTGAGRKHAKNVGHTDSHPPETGPSVALIRPDRDS